MKVVRYKRTDLSVRREELEDLIGLPPFDESIAREPTPGLGVGLAYNAYGGSLMYIEIVRTNHETTKTAGALKLTG